MNIGELRRIIHEEVVAAMREELREILTEATETIKDQRPVQRTTTRLSDLFPVEKTSEPKTLEDILQETARNMGGEDYRTLLGENQVQQTAHSAMPGMPDFLTKAVMKAKSVLDTSNQKDRERHGI